MSLDTTNRTSADPTSLESTSATRPTSLVSTTLVVGLLAAAITAAAAAILHTAGVSFEIEGETIPVSGFALVTFVGAVIGGLLLAALVRWSASARHRFLLVTVALTALSCVPSITSPDDTATKVALVALHLLAAAIVIPVLARRAHD